MGKQIFVGFKKNMSGERNTENGENKFVLGKENRKWGKIGKPGEENIDRVVKKWGDVNGKKLT